uniref:Sec-independent protein translocase component TatC n=1 Tax=Kapraunia schneideri TaxID=717899 RepID=A0A1Z1MS45_9FLOR|nr:Sec-independent protein translocase component TatC [Kapraunia schneideri]ARW68923.1 Sec-independent protein translocase component TatC [Kapraunia schneideri]
MKSVKYEEKYMTILEHLQELKQRILLTFLIFILVLSICIIYTKEISFILQQPALGIKFLQLAPGEYLFVSVKVASYAAIFIISPLILYQIIQFISPGLTRKENKYVIPTSICSLCLFFLGGIFSYKAIIPITINFLIGYGSDVVEPVWSFEEYFNFISLTLLTTGICFQLPILQVILGITNIVSWKEMLRKWKYITFISTIISAIITPSTDPLTQILMSITIIILYSCGIFIVKTLQKTTK